MTPSQVGERAEAALIAALILAGKTVYTPIGGSGRCDLLFQDATGISRVQVKNGVLRKTIVFFRTSSNTKNIPRDYRGQIDYFGVYCHDLLATFLVPVDAVPLRAGTLRLTPTRNNQGLGIRWAEDYRLAWSPAQLVIDGFAVE